MGGPKASKPHGTPAAARRHYRRGEKPCEECRIGQREARRERTGADPYRELEPGPQPPPRNALPIVGYQWGRSRDDRAYSWAVANIRRAEAIHGAPEADDGARWADREAG